VPYNFEMGNKKIKLIMEHKSVTHKVLFGNAVLAAFMYDTKYDVIPQNGYCSRVTLSYSVSSFILYLV
jgi:hypothetical protein